MGSKTISLRAGNITISKYYVYTICIGILIIVNSVSAKIPLLGLLTGTVETLFMVCLLLGWSIQDFTIWSLILLSSNIENPGFALGDRTAVFYSIYNLPAVHGYLLLLIMLGALAKCYLVYGISKPGQLKTNGYHRFYFYNFILFVTGILMALLTIAINDNGMLAHSDMWRYVARDAYQMIYVISILTLVWSSLRNDPGFINKMKDIMLGILSAVTYASIILILCGNYYNIWGTEFYITCPLILFFAPGLIIFLFEEHGLFNLLTGIIAALVQLRYTVGIAGTWWLYIILIGVIFIRKIMAVGGNVRDTFLKTVCIFGAAGILYYIFASGVLDTISGQVTYKLSRILDFFEGNGNILDRLSGSGGSVSMRIEEMVSALIEVIKKPWFILFGKGFGGTVSQHWGSSDWNVSGSTFSDIMIKYKTYSAFHIAIAEIMINFGLAGIALILQMIKEFVSEFIKKDGSSWILIGVLWFVFFYSLYYSFNLGLVWICCGLYMKYDKKGIKVNENSVL